MAVNPFLPPRPRHPAPQPHILDGALEFVTAFLHEPTTSGGYICMTRFAGACRVISHEWNSHVTVVSKTKFARSCPRLLRAAIGFITSAHSTAERTDIVTYLLHCQHGCPSCPMIPIDDPTDEESLNEAYHTLLSVPLILLSQLLIRVLAELTRNKFRNPKPGIAPDTQPWPLCPLDLFPNGMRNTIKGLSFWADKRYSEGDPIPSIVMLDLAANLASFHTPFARELMRPPYTLGLLQPLGQLEESILMPDLSLIKSPPVSCIIYDREILPVVGVIEALLYCDRDGFIEMLVNTKDKVLPIIERLTFRLALLPPPVWGSHMALLKGFAAMAKAIKDPRGGGFIIPDSVTEEFNKAKAVVESRTFDIRSTFEVMVPARKGGCWNIACPNSGGNGMPKLRLCSRCDLLRYCGQQCQKEAWKHDQHPHKELCTLVRTFKDQLGSEVWSMLWVPGFDLNTFILPPRARSADIKLAQEIGDRLALLLAAKARHSHSKN